MGGGGPVAAFTCAGHGPGPQHTPSTVPLSLPGAGFFSTLETKRKQLRRSLGKTAQLTGSGRRTVASGTPQQDFNNTFPPPRERL